MNEITDENFFDKFKRINFLTESVRNLREETLKLYPRSELKKNEEKINILTKEIKTKLDNMITEKEKLSGEIKKKLNILQNRKKISNYGK